MAVKEDVSLNRSVCKQSRFFYYLDYVSSGESLTGLTFISRLDFIRLFWFGDLLYSIFMDWQLLELRTSSCILAN